MSAKWRISWQPPEGGVEATYNVYYRTATDGAVWTLAGSTAGREWTLEVQDTLDTYEAAVAPVVNGIEAAEPLWGVYRFVPSSLADIDPPPAVAALAVAQIDQSFDVRLRWSAVQDVHLAGYEIREGAAWETALVRKFVAHDPNATADLETTLGIMAVKTTAFQVRAKSKHGQYSASSASATFVAQAPSTHVVETATDEQGGGFAGTKTNMEVESGGLQVSKAPATMNDWTDTMDSYTWPWAMPHHTEGSYVTDAIEAQDEAGNGLVVDEVVTVDLAGAKQDPASWPMELWQWIIVPVFEDGTETTAIDPDTPAKLHKVSMDGTVLEGLDLTIEIDTTPDDPAGAPTWDGWRPWVPGARYRYRGVRLRITVNCPWLWTWRVTTFTIKRYRLNLKTEKLVTVAKTENYSLVRGDFHVEFDCSSGNLTATLPNATTHDGEVFEIVKSTIPNVLTIATTGSQTINGELALEIHDQYVCVTLLATGGNWRIV